MSQSISPGNTITTLDEKEATSLLKLGPYPLPTKRGDEPKIVTWDEKGRTKVVQMFISYDTFHIHSIAFQYIEGDKLVTSPIFGSPNLDRPKFITVMLTEAANDEYITRLSGSYALNDYKLGQGVTSLTIETNVTTYGPFGNYSQNSPKFEYSFGPENQFGGFHGTSSNDILNSIGVYVKPIQDLATLSKKIELHVE